MPRRTVQRRVVLSALAASLICIPSADAASAAQPKPDRTAPTVAFVAPTAGTIVSGSLSGSGCEATAKDKVRVDHVDFSVDGAALNVDRTSPYNCTWNTTGASAGQHVVTASAVDTSGNTAKATVTVTVAAAEPAPTPAPTATPTPSPSPTPQVTLTPVDGGSGYYGKFTNPLPDSPSWFPICVWGSYDHTQAHRDLDAAAGLNCYEWAADSTYMSQIRADGRFVVLQDVDNQANSGSETKGWFLGDEEDMCCGPPGFDGGNGYDHLTAANARAPQDGTIRTANFGKGVLLWESDADAAKFLNLPFLGLASSDLYFMTDPNEIGDPNAPGKYGMPASYGWIIDKQRRLDAMDGKVKPIWATVETGWPFTESAAQGGRAILPAELRAAVWHSIIAGARGIDYFEHSFGGPNAGDHHTIRTNSEGTRPIVTSVNAQIKQLAPVLNSPTVTSGVSTAGAVRAMVKWDGSHFYVFAGATSTANTKFDWSMPCLGDGATAVNLGETTGNLTIPLTAGKFTDTLLDKNAVHIYRIDGGSTCGL